MSNLAGRYPSLGLTFFRTAKLDMESKLSVSP
jgi:hypothetical protein